MKIEFVNGAELVITEFSDPIDVTKVYSDIADIGDEFINFAPENVSTLKIYDDEDIMFAQFDNMFFGGVTVNNILTDGGNRFEAHFTFRQKSEIEVMHEQIAALQASQDLQDGAIEDLADEVFG